MFENPELCSKCGDDGKGGACCKRMPGAAFPEDFGLPGDPAALIAALESGKWAIDCWEGDARRRNYKNKLSITYFVRPATKGKEGKRYDATWGGECTFLTPTGCSLPPDKRPRNCRYVEPKPGRGKCVLHKKSNKRDAAIAWIPYTKYLERP